MPWVLAKNESDRPRLATVIYNLLETIRVAATLLVPYIPATADAVFKQLATDKTEFSTLAVEAVVPAAKAYFRSPETVPDKISRAYFYEKEAVKYSQTIKRKVFHNMPSLKLSEKFHLRYFALHIENLAKAAENVADQLAVMAIRRTL